MSASRTRDENQTESRGKPPDHAALLVVIDGHGRHADARARPNCASRRLLEPLADAASIFDSIVVAFIAGPRATRVVKLGWDGRRSAPPRTCAPVPGPGLRCLLGACGRYASNQLRQSQVLERHSRSQPRRSLLREGLITEPRFRPSDAYYVECGLGGNSSLAGDSHIYAGATQSRRFVAAVYRTAFGRTCRSDFLRLAPWRSLCGRRSPIWDAGRGSLRPHRDNTMRPRCGWRPRELQAELRAPDEFARAEFRARLHQTR